MVKGELHRETKFCQIIFNRSHSFLLLEKKVKPVLMRSLKEPDSQKIQTDLTAKEQVAKRYVAGTTPHVDGTIKGSVAIDPVAKQYVPQPRELMILPEEHSDPIGDDRHTPVKGIVHRHKDRVLLQLTQMCAVYCRYCFRREKVGPGQNILSDAEIRATLSYIRNDSDIFEAILTGGDPLILSPRRLDQVFNDLESIPHVQVIRIHSRVPIADPRRISDALCDALNRDAPIYMVVHINHDQEITPEVESALKRLHDAGCVLLSQSVLLKGVNDSPDTLETLFRKMVHLRVKPYYLHHPDMAPGTSHFRVTIEQGQAIWKTLQARLSGIALPRYMLDIPGGYGKVPIEPGYLESLENGCYHITDPQGQTHRYPPRRTES